MSAPPNNDDVIGVIEVALRKAFPSALVYYSEDDAAVLVLTQEYRTAVGLLAISMWVNWS